MTLCVLLKQSFFWILVNSGRIFTLISKYTNIVQWLVNYFFKAQFEDIKKIVDQMWETLSENLKKVSDVLFWLKT